MNLRDVASISVGAARIGFAFPLAAIKFLSRRQVVNCSDFGEAGNKCGEPYCLRELSAGAGELARGRRPESGETAGS